MLARWLLFWVVGPPKVWLGHQKWCISTLEPVAVQAEKGRGFWNGTFKGRIFQNVVLAIKELLEILLTAEEGREGPDGFALGWVRHMVVVALAERGGLC